MVLTQWQCVCSCHAHRGCWGSHLPVPGSGDGGSPRGTRSGIRSPRWCRCRRCGRGWTCTHQCLHYSGALEGENNPHWAAQLRRECWLCMPAGTHTQTQGSSMELTCLRANSGWEKRFWEMQHFPVPGKTALALSKYSQTIPDSPLKITR